MASDDENYELYYLHGASRRHVPIMHVYELKLTNYTLHCRNYYSCLWCPSPYHCCSFSDICSHLLEIHKIRSRQTNGIYEPIDLLSVPPQLPPRPLHQTIATQENPAYVKVDLIENPAYTSIKTENRASLTVEAESGDHLATGKDDYDELESFADQHSMTAKLNEGRQSPYVELGEAEIVLPMLVASATNPMFLREYDIVASTMKLTCTSKPVRTISANNLTLGVEDSGKDDSACLNIRSKAVITHSKSATNIRTKVEEYDKCNSQRIYTIAQLTTIDHNTATRKDTEIAAESNSSNSSIT